MEREREEYPSPVGNVQVQWSGKVRSVVRKVLGVNTYSSVVKSIKLQLGSTRKGIDILPKWQTKHKEVS